MTEQPMPNQIPLPNQTTKPKLVIFDWDGTLMDSASHIVASLVYAAQQFNVPLTPQAAKSIIGLGLPEAMQVLFPNHPQLQPLIQDVYSKHYVANSQSQLFDGVEQLLQRLKQNNVLLAVATGKSRAGLNRVLQESGLASFFDITRAASETKSKPHPLMLQEILAHTGVAVTDAVMIGDTTYDLEMAQQIDMPSVGVTYGVHTPEQLLVYKPITLVNSVPELDLWLL